MADFALGRFDTFPERFLRGAEKGIQLAFFHPEVLFVFGVIAYASAFYCAAIIEHWSILMIVVLTLLGVLLVVALIHLYQKGYVSTRDLVQAGVVRYRATNMFLKTTGVLAVLSGFVFLSNQIAKNEAKLGLHAVGFFLSCYCLVVSFAKLFGSDDLFGTGDSLMAVTVMLWINNHKIILKDVGEDSKIWCWIGFYVVIVIFAFFKMTEIPLRGYPIPPQNPNGAQTDAAGVTQATEGGGGLPEQREIVTAKEYYQPQQKEVELVVAAEHVKEE